MKRTLLGKVKQTFASTPTIMVKVESDLACFPDYELFHAVSLSARLTLVTPRADILNQNSSLIENSLMEKLKLD
jgi:hypothetical protein